MRKEDEIAGPKVNNNFGGDLEVADDAEVDINMGDECDIVCEMADDVDDAGSPELDPTAADSAPPERVTWSQPEIATGEGFGRTLAVVTLWPAPDPGTSLAFDAEGLRPGCDASSPGSGADSGWSLLRYSAGDHGAALRLFERCRACRVMSRPVAVTSISGDFGMSGDAKQELQRALDGAGVSARVLPSFRGAASALVRALSAQEVGAAWTAAELTAARKEVEAAARRVEEMVKGGKVGALGVKSTELHAKEAERAGGVSVELSWARKRESPANLLGRVKGGEWQKDDPAWLEKVDDADWEPDDDDDSD